MESEEVINERKRIKEIIDRKIQAQITYRKVKLRKRSLQGMFNRLEDDIIFLIDNPDYARIKDKILGSNLSPSLTSPELY